MAKQNFSNELIKKLYELKESNQDGDYDQDNMRHLHQKFDLPEENGPQEPDGLEMQRGQLDGLKKSVEKKDITASEQSENNRNE